LRTASNPLRTLIEAASYASSLGAPDGLDGVSDSVMKKVAPESF
jgi:hypothetical protein